MEYQITCVCGHSFLISEGPLEQPVACPACQRRLSPVVVAPRGSGVAGALAQATDAAATVPTPPSTSPVTAEATKRCRFCGEVILAVARKCKHCGEFLDRAAPEAGGVFPGAAALGVPAAAPSNAAPQVLPGDAVFELAVSQWDNFWKFVIAVTALLAVCVVIILAKPPLPYAVVVILAALVVAGLVGWFFYLSAKHRRVIVRPFRIETETGILSKKLDSLELFRISDVELKQGLVERMLGIGSVNLMTTDSTDEPELVLYQIPKAREVYRYLQTQIPIAAKQRGAVYMEK